jgi:hypothetical protein
MDLAGMPVTLVVKAPNQKIGDQTIECDFAWTIQKVKEHLSSVYPSKPKEDQQKLIYSGRLLQDHLVLKDVLRQYDEELTTHTVHLVCASSLAESFSTFDSNSSIDSTSVNGSPVPTPPSTPPNTGLRHRNVQNSAPTTTASMVPPTGAPPATPMSPQDAFLQMYGANNPMMAYGGGYYPGMNYPGMGMSPEQMLWMQQMYTQQMAQFMQLYQPGTFPTTPPPTPGVDSPDVDAANQDPANNAAAGNARPAAGNQQIRMNAGGGPVVDEDEEEGGNRDWLDWVYTLSRFSVLLSIVYFYSTLGRFVVVFGLFFLVYLYQGGFLRLRRRVIVPNNNNNNRQQAPQQQQQQQQEPQQQPQPAAPPAEDIQQNVQQPENIEGQQNADNSVDGGDVAAEVVPVEPPAPPQPRPLAIAWSFISTFFSSLIPTQPVVVNAN